MLPFGVRGPFGSAPARNSAFLPSFVVILAGVPVVETTHGKLVFTAPLAAFTAVVVGVVLKFATFVAYHVVWPAGIGGRFDGALAAIAVVAAIALFRFRVEATKAARSSWVVTA